MFDVNTNANINANINVNIYADADANVNILADACINILAHLTRTPTCSQSICDAYQFLPCKTASDEAVLHGLVGSGDVDENPQAFVPEWASGHLVYTRCNAAFRKKTTM